MKQYRKPITAACSFLMLLIVAFALPALAQTYVTPASAGWAFAVEAPTGAGAFVYGPGTPPSGSPGSVQLAVGNPGGELFFTQQYAGTPLSQLTGLGYSTYVVSSALPVTATMQFDFDNDLTSPTLAYGGRAVFDPALLGAVVAPGIWQTWNPMTQKAWWGSGTPGTRPLNMVCTQASPCTLAQIITAFPNGGILSDLFPGYFGFKLGNGGGPSQVSIDSFTIGTGGLGGPVTQFNFAPAPPSVATAVPALSLENLLLLVVLTGLVAFRALRRRE
jgi:hypothetical protein